MICISTEVKVKSKKIAIIYIYMCVCVYMYIYISHFAVHLKLTHFKSTMLQFKKIVRLTAINEKKTKNKQTKKKHQKTKKPSKQKTVILELGNTL